MDCKQGTQLIIQQIEQLLGQLSADAYSRPLEVFDGGTLGQHFRHIYDFYECLFRGLHIGQVDYAGRRREQRLETGPGHAREAFRKIGAQCTALQAELPVAVRGDFSAEAAGERPLLGSTAGRELMFAFDHAVHHLALIRIGLREAMPGLRVSDRLGIAPSTSRHQFQTLSTNGRA